MVTLHPVFCFCHDVLLARGWATITASTTKYNDVSSRQRSHSSGKDWRKLLLFLSRSVLVATSGEAFSPSTHQTILHSGVSFCSPLDSDDIILTSDLLNRARALLPWENQLKKDSEPVLNLSAKNSDALPLADGFGNDAVASSSESDKSTPCSRKDGSVWRETERALVAAGILVDDDSDNKSNKLTREVIVEKAPQLLRLPTDQITESANFFLGNSTDESPTLDILLQLDPSLLTYTISQLDYGITYLSNMMFRGDRMTAIQMIQSQCCLSPSMGLQLIKLGVDGGIEESRIAQLLGSAGSSSGKALKGVVGDMSKDIREWKRVKGGKNSLG
ncbi:hypothetical protein ACHAXM_007059 [Skeletonema potamos]